MRLLLGWNDRTKRRAAQALGSLALLLVAACGSRNVAPHGPEFTEPVVLASANGVLEVKLFLRQGEAVLDTVRDPVQNFLLFSYELLQGTASNGEVAGEDLYPGPSLQVYPGETLIVHIVNELDGLTIPDYYHPAFTPANETVPLYPPQLTNSPFNLHVHGLHVSPKGNSDNVLLNIPQGFTNTYEYLVPTNMPEGMYWYHSHLHTLTAPQSYTGLAGLLLIGRTDGNIPLVTEQDIPIRNMALQYNFVFDRQGGQSTLNNPNWPQYVSTLEEPTSAQIADGTYRPSLAPLNFNDSTVGTTFVTSWWTGPLSVDNNRGEFQFIPSNLQTFTSGPYPGLECPGPYEDGTDVVQLADPSLPDRDRDVQFTINGLFQPEIRAKPGQTEIWVLSNVSDFAYIVVRLTETATGRHPPIAIVGQDGNPYPEVHYPDTNDGTTLAIPPASRYAIAVTLPDTGELVLDMPPRGGNTPEKRSCAILYTNDGTPNPPGVLGTVAIEPSAISYLDGFFVFPTQVLARMRPEPGRGVTTAFVEGQALDAYTSFVDTEGVEPDVERVLTIGGGFLNENASSEDPKAFVYSFDDNTFPFIPLIQPRLNTIEEWSFVNFNNDEHPIHIHVNDFQVSRLVDPVAGIETGFQPWGQDNANVPAPTDPDAQGNVVPGELSVRTKFEDYTGAFVMHCHRLNHEDNGLMALVNVIPQVSSFAVAAESIRLYDSDGDRFLAEVPQPFPGATSLPSVAMGDIDGDNVLDLVAGAGPGSRPEIAVYSGASNFSQEIVRFLAFPEDFRGGVSVAAADFDANPSSDNIVAASGPGLPSRVSVYSSTLPTQLGEAPAVFATLSPYADSTAGVIVTTGMLDITGRQSIITVPGPGVPARVKTFRMDLYTPNSFVQSFGVGSELGRPMHGNHIHLVEPRETSSFLAFDAGYTAGVSLASGWIAGQEGGLERIIVGQLAAPGAVTVFSSGSKLDGEPLEYLAGPDHHNLPLIFKEMSSFVPFGQSPMGVHVAVTSTVHGADLLVSGAFEDDSGTFVRIAKYTFERPTEDATIVVPKEVGVVETEPGDEVRNVGGA